jgi:hypothetical protein
VTGETWFTRQVDKAQASVRQWPEWMQRQAGLLPAERTEGAVMAETTWLDVVREVFPDADDDTASHLLWNHTGFPHFWHIPRDGATPPECAVTQLRALKDGRACADCGGAAEHHPNTCTWTDQLDGETRTQVMCAAFVPWEGVRWPGRA